MNYVCIACGATWRVGKPTDEPSGGLCDRCIRRYVRKNKEAGDFTAAFEERIKIAVRNRALTGRLATEAWQSVTMMKT